MWPKTFEYLRASSLEEAIESLGQNENAKLLAGGHSLLPAMKLRLAEPATLVDIGRLGLGEMTSNGQGLNVGALATHAKIAANAGDWPALAQAAAGIGDPQVRNFGTIGGNIAHADPASDPPAVLIALNATVNLQGPAGARSVAAEDFFIDLFTTALGADEVITSVTFPISGNTSAYAKLAHPASRYALVGVAVEISATGQHCHSARIAVNGATTHALRASAAEAALENAELNEATLDQAAEAIQADIADQLLGDATYPEDYRQAMSGVFLKRAIHAALS